MKTKELQDSIFIYINIYGASSVGDNVGKILSANRIYLQHPINNEKKLKYKNPHYFDVTELVLTAQATASRPRIRNVEEKVKTIFDSNINDKLPEIKMGDELQTSLLSHQKQAVYFMLWKETALAFHAEDMLTSTSIYKPIKNELGVVSYLNSITKETTCERPQAVSGGILADDMGLGKSLTTLALITASLDQAHLFTWSTNSQYCPMSNRTRATLIVAPASRKSFPIESLTSVYIYLLMQNPPIVLDSWREQIHTHVKPGALSFYSYHGAQKDISIEKLIDFDIILTTYGTIRAEVFSKQVNKYRRSSLKEITWFRIVLDEAHIIREHSTQQSRAVCMLEAQRRWCLSGTPIQNKLQDFGTLLRFLRLSPFDEDGAFSKYIVRPLKDASPEGLRCLRVLIGSTCLRRNKDILELPPKIDQEVYIHLEPPERGLYESCKKDSANMIEHALTERGSGSSYFSILQSILRLRLMCDHGKDLLPSVVQNRLAGYSNTDYNPSTSMDIDMGDYADVQEESPTQSIASGFLTPRCALCNEATDAAESDAISSSQDCSHTICDSCLKLYELNTTQLGTSSQISCPKCAEAAGFSLEGLKDEDNPRWMEDRPYGGPSTKVKALIKNLQLDARKDSEGKPIKSVVFSCWTKMLDLIAIALKNEQMGFYRYDGRLSMRQRDESVRCFRADPQINILLISIGSGAVGLNLTVASRVHLMEPQWNPMVEHQALDRLHRIGQKNKVVTTRYIVKNSIEEVSAIPPIPLR
ncbi:SNF2 family N-terminal domain-containing protein [Morchella snyderi]|nr:SNF2 family N-terminal domain-containing protein [Morchella snyderi]